MSRKIIDSMVIDTVLESNTIEALRYKYNGDEIDDTKPVTTFPKEEKTMSCMLTYKVRNRYTNYMRLSTDTTGEFLFNDRIYVTPKPIMCLLKALVLEHVSDVKEYSEACIAVFMLLVQKLPTGAWKGELVLPASQVPSLVEMSIFNELSDFYKEVLKELDKS